MHTKNPTARETMEAELMKVMVAQSKCVNEYGFIRSECRYRYQLLVRIAQKFKDSIDYLNSIGL